MKKYMKRFGIIVLALAFVLACSEDEDDIDSISGASVSTDLSWIEEETYSGGLLGTTFNQSATAYEDPTPAVENAGLETEFKYGEYFFERSYTQTTAPFSGLGPLYVRTACMDCHPGYGHGMRMNRYRFNDYGNGYLLAIFDKTDNSYVTSVTGTPQTKAVEPFKAPIDESQIVIDWLEYTDDWGNTFPDGETYSLIYPEVTIPESAFYVPIVSQNGVIPIEQVGVRLESTIGVYGTGLIEAIDNDDLLAQYVYEDELGLPLNPDFYSNGSWVYMYENPKDGEKYAGRFNYSVWRALVMADEALWDVMNVTRSDRMYHYMTEEYAETASQDPDVQAVFYEYFPEQNRTGNVETDIYNYLIGQYTDEDGNTVSVLEAEMSDEDYVNFMIWHRGLAVPAARDLDDETVQEGRQLFREIGCSLCHKPSWTTGADVTPATNYFAKGDSRLPSYPYQTIWPYTDLIQHRLYMVNDILGGWCRTTPLWGRGLSLICAGHQDRLHDCRARNVIEAIMWHGSAESDARISIEKFRELSASERDAVVAFINAI